MNNDHIKQVSNLVKCYEAIDGGRPVASELAPSEPQAQSARCSVAVGSASGFLELLAGVVEAERLVVAGLKPEMPCRKMHENRHRAFREALSMATAYFQPNAPVRHEPKSAESKP